MHHSWKIKWKNIFFQQNYVFVSEGYREREGVGEKDILGQRDRQREIERE